jgi:hypothetical protein
MWGSKKLGAFFPEPSCSESFTSAELQSLQKQELSFFIFSLLCNVFQLAIVATLMGVCVVVKQTGPEHLPSSNHDTKMLE